MQATPSVPGRGPARETAAAVPSAVAGVDRLHLDLVGMLLAKDLKLRYRNTVLGYAWSVLHPLAFAAVFYTVFGVFIRLNVEDYALFLITGLFPWHWIQNSAGASTMHFLGNSSLIKKVRFPRLLLVVAAVLNDLIHFLLTLPVIVLFLLLHRRIPSLSWLYQVPAMVMLTFLTTTGMALLIGTCTVFLRDIERLVSILLVLWFYLTPVLYPPTMIPARYQWINYANPLAPVINGWRGVFLDGNLPPEVAGTALVWGVLFLAVGYRVYRGLEWRFAELV